MSFWIVIFTDVMELIVCTTLFEGKTAFFSWAQDHLCSPPALHFLRKLNGELKNYITGAIIGEHSRCCLLGRDKQSSCSVLHLPDTNETFSYFLSYLDKATLLAKTCEFQIFSHSQNKTSYNLSRDSGTEGSPGHIQISNPATW